MSHLAKTAEETRALEALTAISGALRQQPTSRAAALSMLTILREQTGAQGVILSWTRDILLGATRSDVLVHPPEYDQLAASQPVRRLITRALHVPDIVEWEQRPDGEVSTLGPDTGFSRCLVVPLETATRRTGVLLLVDAPTERVAALRWLIEAYAAVLSLSSPWAAAAAAATDSGDVPSPEPGRLRRIERALANAVSEVHDLHEGLHLCLDAAIQVGGLDSGGFYLVDDNTGALECVVHQGLSDEFVASVARYEPDSLHAKVVLAGAPMYVEFGRSVRSSPDAERREGIRLLAVVPLKHDGRVIGCLNVASHSADNIPVSRRHALESVAAEAAHAIARLRAEFAMRDSEARAQALLSAIPDLLFRVSRDGVFLDFRADQRDLYVQDRSRIIGTHYQDLLPPNVVAIIDERMSAAFASGKLQTFEYQLTMPGDVAAEYEGRMIVSGPNEVTVIVRDITEHNRSQRQIRENERRFRHLIESANDWIWESDPAGLLSYCSPHCEAISGYSPAELVGHSIFSLIVAHDLAKAREFSERLQQKPVSFRGFEWTIVRKDGTEAVLESNGVPVFDEAGHLAGFRGVHRDITARRTEEAETKRLQGELAQAQKMESVGRLAGGVAHDFNNMLQAILGNAALAMRGLALDNPVRDRLTEIENCAQRSADLTRQLLAFARKQTATPRHLDLNRAVEGMLKMLRRLIGEDIQLAWLPGDALGQVRIDPSQVDQILANLCVNARDAIAGQGLVTISTSTAVFDADAVADFPEAVPGTYVRLSISDNGSGMPPSVLARAMEPFFTTKELGRGTGLGLSTVYGIVRQNGGFLQLQSEMGVGTRIEIYLPVVDAAPHAATVPVASPEMARGHETILLVEDEAAILAVAQSMLESLGYAVLTAGTPGAALEIAAQHPHTIHLLVTDVVMPEMNGLELARQLTPMRPHIRKLYTSGYTSDVMAQHGIVESGIHFVQKPFDLDTIARKVRDALDDVGQDVVMA